MARARRRADAARVKRRVRRRHERFGLDTSPRAVGRAAAAPKWCTHAGCVNPRCAFGKVTLQEQRAPDAREVAAEAAEYRDLPHYPFIAPD